MTSLPNYAGVALKTGDCLTSFHFRGCCFLSMHNVEQSYKYYVRTSIGPLHRSPNTTRGYVIDLSPVTICAFSDTDYYLQIELRCFTVGRWPITGLSVSPSKET